MESTVKANAKLNLLLSVGNKLKSGRHQLQSVMISVDIFDTVKVVERADKAVNVQFNNGDIIIDEIDNTAFKVAQLFIRQFNTAGVDIYIDKVIPMQGGMGGSSADAAAVLVAMCRMYNIPMSNTVKSIAEQVGSDVSFMMFGGLGYVGGEGQIVDVVPCDYKYEFVVVQVGNGLSTRVVYDKLDKLKTTSLKKSCSRLIEALCKGDLPQIVANIGNNMTKAAISLQPNIKQAMELLSGYFGVNAVAMTGSGSCVYAMVNTRKQGEYIVNEMTDKGYIAYCCKSVDCGVE